MLSRRSSFMSKKIRIFQIGFNKCGTRSFSQFFRLNGHKVVHWDKGNLAKKMKENFEQEKSPVAGYSDRTFFSDMEYLDAEGNCIEIYKEFEKLYTMFPHAYFILNTRDVDEWIQSRLKHGSYFKYYKKHLGLKSKEDVIKYWRMDWYRHHYKVLDFFKDKGNLLTFTLKKDKPSLICDFFKNELDLNPDFFGIVGKTNT